MREGQGMIQNDVPEYGSRAYFETLAAGRNPAVAGLLRHFGWTHLADSLRDVSAALGVTAMRVAELLPDSPELTVALRKLIEAKDCAVRAAVDAKFGAATVPGRPEPELR